ncbi:hypothetical protein [Bacillus sp. UNC41MFS5]|nr:hypothetical protein [Bacillus sp. UNC41MFS5]
MSERSELSLRQLFLVELTKQFSSTSIETILVGETYEKDEI